MIHQYKLNGYNIVLDTYSGSIHTTDELGYEVIGALDELVRRVCGDKKEETGEKDRKSVV